MIDILRECVTRPIHALRRIKARAALKQLRTHESPPLRAIAEALAESLARTLSAEEQAWMESIEQRRALLLGSDQEIDVTDHGAGAPDSRRTKDEMERGVVSSARVADISASSIPPFWGTVLFKMIRKLKPTSCVELGSCVGISASYLAAALRINGTGSLQTLEGSPELAAITEGTLEGLGLDNTTVVIGPFHETLGGVLESARPLDFLFNDGQHDRDAVIRYLDDAFPHLSSEAILVFDDISWSPGMREAWNHIEHDERVAASIDLGPVGVALVGRTAGVRLRVDVAAFDDIR